MSSQEPSPWKVGSLLTQVRPAGRHGQTRLATATLGGRRVLLAELSDTAAGDAVAVAALARDQRVAALILAPHGLSGAARLPAGPGPADDLGLHVVVGPEPNAATRAGLEARGLLLVTHGPGAPALLGSEELPTAIDLAALLLSYLPAPDGVRPVYGAADPVQARSADGAGWLLEPGPQRNALAVVHSIADDALRLLAGEEDTLVLALARVEGSTVAVVAAQPLGGEHLGEETLARLTTLIRITARADVPLLVLGTPQPVGADRVTTSLLLRELAAAVIALRRPVLLVPDESPVSEVAELLHSATSTVELTRADLGSVHELRTAIASWLP